MKILSLSLLLSTVIFQHALAQAKSAEGFTLVKRDGAIAIYERWIIFPDSDPPQEAREVKGEFAIQSTMYKVLALIKDQKKIKIWQRHVTEFRIYPQPDTTFWLEYSYHDIPWPVSDQDHFLEYQLVEKKPGEELFLTFKSRKDPVLAPKQDGVARMILSGSWQLQRLSADQVKVTYRILSMPIGIPRLFTDPVIRNNMMSTMQRLTALAEQ